MSAYPGKYDSHASGTDSNSTSPTGAILTVEEPPGVAVDSADSAVGVDVGAGVSVGSSVGVPVGSEPDPVPPVPVHPASNPPPTTAPPYFG